MVEMRRQNHHLALELGIAAFEQTHHILALHLLELGIEGGAEGVSSDKVSRTSGKFGNRSPR
jgi:hypothetical protein